MSQISAELRELFNDFLSYADTDVAPEGWRTDCGLCMNAARRGVFHELDAIFEDEFGPNAYPFGRTHYEYALKNGEHHKHRPRIDWVRKIMAQ